MSSALKQSAVFLLLLLLAGCATRVPSPQDVQAKRFEAVPGQSVIYVFRDRFDFTESPTPIMLDGQLQGASYRGTYFRIELAPGRHNLGGYAGDNGRYDFETAAGKIYFIRHSVNRLIGFDLSFFQPVAPEYGRQAVSQYELNGVPPQTH